MAAARSQARIPKSDLDGLVAQINEKRALLQRDLQEAITADKELRAARDAAVEKVREAQAGASAELQSAASVEQARVETSGRKIESLRAFLRLAD
jgi:serine phosphatase RsbU (regulator of sigma subunit)